MGIYILSNKNILSNENIFLSNENNFYRMQIYFYRMKIIFIEFCYLSATINCDPQLQQNMLNANRTLHYAGTYEELRNRSFPRMVRAHDVCLQWFLYFVCSASFLFAAHLFCLKRSFFVCSASFLFAAFVFCLQRVPCGPSLNIDATGSVT